MNIVTPAQMAEIDRLTMEDYGLHPLVLMENAARSCLRYLPEGQYVTVLVGPGNNGGDGLVLARALKEQGRSVRALLLPEKISVQSETQRRLALEWGVSVWDKDSNLSLEQVFLEQTESSLVIDGIFGTGLARDLENPYRQAVTWANSLSTHRFAIDIPSGIDGRNGQVLGTAFNAHQTVTFGCLKLAHVLFPGRQHCGEIHLTQPGFHPESLQMFDRLQLFTEEWAQRFLPRLWPTMHKGDNGRILLVTGSERYPGAGILTVLGALKAGAGLVTHSCAPQHVHSSLNWAPECMPVPRPELPELGQFNAIVIGSGLGEESESIGLEVAKRAGCPLLLDADSIPHIEKLTSRQRTNTVITPHPGEMARLLDCTVEEVESNRVSTALSASEEFGCVVCLKGAPTVTASPDGRAFLNTTGNPVLAQGGTGDLLAGIIGAHLAYGLPALEAAAGGAYLHGLAADLATAPRGSGAHEIAELVPIAYRQAVGKNTRLKYLES